MEAVVIYPADANQLKALLDFAEENKIPSIALSEEEKKRLAGILLANFAKKNPKATATMDEIISVVEEVRKERYEKSN